MESLASAQQFLKNRQKEIEVLKSLGFNVIKTTHCSAKVCRGTDGIATLK